jgi:hypothetical protein
LTVQAYASTASTSSTISTNLSLFNNLFSLFSFSLLSSASYLMIHMDKGGDTLWLPKPYQDLRMMPYCIVYKSSYGSNTVVQTAPKVVIKYEGVFSEEIICARFARCKTSLPVPRIIHHPPFTRYSSIGAWYICMVKIPGVSLDKVIDTLTVEQLSHLPAKVHLAQLQSVGSSKMLGSVSGGPYRNEFFPPHVAPKHAFSSVGEFLDHYREMLMLFCTELYTESLLSRIPRNAAIKFTHGDLLPKNIMVEGSRITGI